MFDHSIRVPRLYKAASKIARDVAEGKGSIKQLVYEGKHPNIKALYALVVQTFQKTDDIENVLKKSKLLTKEPRFDSWLAKILITELLWGKKRLTSEAKPIKTILAYEQILKAHLSDDTNSYPTELESVDKPRYVRINTLKISINEAVEAFRDEGWVLKRFVDKSYEDFLQAISELTLEEFMVDIHIPELLIFPPKTQFYKHSAYKNGSIILQDKASCLPVHILSPEPGSTILDMCSAPGMKTTHAAARIENNGLIYAVEMGTKRFETLTKIIESAGATCVKPINRDVLTLTREDISNVDYIIVDPSCSGSGLTDRVEIGQQSMDQDRERIDKLAGFQIKILRHALTRFPQAKRVVYSTCSLFPEENEDVVRQVLETCSTFKLVSAGEYVQNAWLNYGSYDFGEIGPRCLYSQPNVDMTSGFFVAVFQRLENGEVNEFYSSNLRMFSKKVQRDEKRKEKRRQQVVEGEKNAEEVKKEADKNNGTALVVNKVDEVVVKKEKKSKKRKNEDQIVEVKEEPELTEKKKKKRDKSGEVSVKVDEDNLEEIPVAKKYKKKKQKSETTENLELKEEIVEESPKKKKKRDKSEVSVKVEEDNSEKNVSIGKEKKNKKQNSENLEVKEEIVEESIEKKKKKRNKSEKVSSLENNLNEIPLIKKEKKKDNKTENTENLELKEEIVEESLPKKKKKKKDAENLSPRSKFNKNQIQKEL